MASYIPKNPGSITILNIQAFSVISRICCKCNYIFISIKMNSDFEWGYTGADCTVQTTISGCCKPASTNLLVSYRKIDSDIFRSEWKGTIWRFRPDTKGSFKKLRKGCERNKVKLTINSGPIPSFWQRFEVYCFFAFPNWYCLSLGWSNGQTFHSKNPIANFSCSKTHRVWSCSSLAKKYLQYHA